MKLNLLLKSVVFFSMLTVSSQTFATLITFNGDEVNALDLNGISGSFEDFYNYDKSSAHTGFEIANAIIMFIAELNGEYGIFTIVNEYGTTGVNGHLNVNVNSSSGEVIFNDDPAEYSATGNTTYYWAGHLTDGFIFSNFDDEFTFSQTLSSKYGVDGLYFINFTDGTVSSQEYSDIINLDSTTSFAIEVANVSAPLTFSLMLIGASFVLMRNGRDKM